MVNLTNMAKSPPDKSGDRRNQDISQLGDWVLLPIAHKQTERFDKPLQSENEFFPVE